MRSIILGSLLVFSIILNIATVSVSSVAATVSGLFHSVTGMGTVLGAAGEALSLAQARLATKEADLKTKEAKIVDLTGELDSAKATNTQLDGELSTERRNAATLDADLKATKKKNVELLQDVADLKAAQIVKYRGNDRLLKDAVKDTSQRISKRTAAGASRNVAATFGEAWPVAGTAVIVTATTLELYDACVIMQDLHELDVAFNSELASGADAQEVCGMKVPTTGEIWAKVKSSPGEVWAKMREMLPDLPEMLPDLPEMPDFPNPVGPVVIINPFDGYEIRLPWE